MTVRIITGDCREVLKTLESDSLHCCVTSPPYFGLRDYGVEGQIGLELNPDAFIEEMVAVFREVRRVLRPDGTLWLNLGDSYANDGKWGGHTGGKHVSALHASPIGRHKKYTGFKPKDLMCIPHRTAMALQEDGWWLRQTLPWIKRNPMPESTNDRPTVAIEYVFQMTKSEKYFYDYAAVQRTASQNTHKRLAQAVEAQIGRERANGGRKTNGNMKAVRGKDTEASARTPNSRPHSLSEFEAKKITEATTKKQDGHGRRHAGFNERYFDLPKSSEPGSGIKNNDSMNEALAVMPEKRAFRNSDLFFDAMGAITDGAGNIVALDVTTQPFKGSHFATFPPKLIEPLIMASCPAGGTVLDPFGGAATTGVVADRMGRDAVLIELNPDYVKLAERRIGDDAGMFHNLAAQ